LAYRIGAHAEGAVKAGTKPVLVLGLPRSGTTWTAQLLAAAPGVVGVMEPDNEKTSAVALEGKRGLGRFPVLGAGDEAGSYRRMWSWALAGAPVGSGLRVGDRLLRSATAERRESSVSGRVSPALRLAGLVAGFDTRPSVLARRTGESGTRGGDVRVIVKSVHAPLAAEWLAEAFDLEVLVILRHPANVLASWLALDLPDRDRALDRSSAVQAHYGERWGLTPPGPDPIDRAVWHLGLMTAALEEAVVRHPEWHVRVHEELCTDPGVEFRRLFADLGLDWTEAVDAELEAGNRPGEGFTLHRRASEAADAWRTRLGAPELASLRRVLPSFPLQHWSADDIPGETCAG
jgi:hypothetical protein